MPQVDNIFVILIILIMEKYTDLIFDVDGTLYLSADNTYVLFQQNIARVLSERFDYKPESLAIDKLKNQLLKLRDVVNRRFAETGFTFRDFMEEVCDVDVSSISPSPELCKRLKSLPQRKYLFTDSTIKHVRDVLQQLQITEDCFSGILDGTSCHYCFKSNVESYQILIELFELNPEHCIMIEDSPQNLKAAKLLGMTTVLITPKLQPFDYVDYQFATLLEALDFIAQVNQVDTDL